MEDTTEDYNITQLELYINYLKEINDKLYKFDLGGKDLKENVITVIDIVTYNILEYKNFTPKKYENFKEYENVFINNIHICMFVVYHIKMYLNKINIDYDFLTTILKKLYELDNNHEIAILSYLITKKYNIIEQKIIKSEINELYKGIDSLYNENYKDACMDNILDDNIDNYTDDMDDDNKYKLINFCINFLSNAATQKIKKTAIKEWEYFIELYEQDLKLTDVHIKMINKLYEIYQFKHLVLELLQKYTTDDLFTKMIT